MFLRELNHFNTAHKASEPPLALWLSGLPAGRGDPTINELPQAHDIIVDFDSQRQRIFEKAAEKYRNGSSTDEISQEFGLPKTSVREGLQRLGLRLRTRQETRGHSKPPYGFVYVTGQLVEHPVEQKRVKVILGLAERGLKAWRIKEELSKLKIPPRTGKSWYHKTIKKIIDAKDTATEVPPGLR